MNIGSKSQLAKLLATEDISVEHANVETAYFDLKARKGGSSQLEGHTPELYDLLLATRSVTLLLPRSRVGMMRLVPRALPSNHFLMLSKMLVTSD